MKIDLMRHDLVMTAGIVRNGSVEKPWQCRRCKRYFTRKRRKPGVCKLCCTDCTNGFSCKCNCHVLRFA